MALAVLELELALQTRLPSNSQIYHLPLPTEYWD